MNQDEAWKAHVEEYDRDRFDSTSRHRRHCFDAGWEATLADTLGLLETLADRDATGSIMLMVDKNINLIVQAHWSPYRYFSCAFEDNEGTRAEAEALLGKGKAK